MKYILLALVHTYRFTFSYFTKNSCRFQPSCSAYALEALQKHRWPKAFSLIAGRISRCHPYGRHGHDPVPER
ncbi:MAG: membrane protein insertion efficiency factor YidD [Dongiaceae bacterium]